MAATPITDEWTARLDAVLHVLYLIFNEGYATSDGPDLQTTALSNEAIRLARLLLATRQTIRRSWACWR